MTLRDDLIAKLNDQKGQLMALKAIMTALLRALPEDMREEAFDGLEAQAEAARTAFLNSMAPDDVAAAFEHYISRVIASR